MEWQQRAGIYSRWYKRHKEKLSRLRTMGDGMRWSIEARHKAEELGIKTDDEGRPIPPEVRTEVFF